jgi:hypothetical protein
MTMTLVHLDELLGEHPFVDHLEGPLDERLGLRFKSLFVNFFVSDLVFPSFFRDTVRQLLNSGLEAINRLVIVGKNRSEPDRPSLLKK